LEPHIEAARHRDEAKRALAAEVVARRLSLRAAADHFRRLNEADPGHPPGAPRPPTDEAAECDWVLHLVWENFKLQGRYAAAARWYDEVFAADPHVLTDPPTNHRYHAACAAARAGCGQGRDAADLDEATRAGFRRQALGWLRADLEARRRLLEQEPEKTRGVVASNLHAWLWDPHFAGVRGPEALAQLPAAERPAWQKFWADVADTVARAVGMLPR
jgi:hypothetical protein